MMPNAPWLPAIAAPATHMASVSAETKPHRLQENLGAADIELSAAELTEIEAAAAKIDVQGGRYADAQERMTNL